MVKSLLDLCMCESSSAAERRSTAARLSHKLMNIICVTRDGALLAFVAFKMNVKESTCMFGYIYEVHVAHDERRKKLAFHLLQSAEKIIQESGQSQVALTVLSDNAPAKALYKKSGYSFAYGDVNDNTKSVWTKVGM